MVDTLKDENLVTQFEDLSRTPPRPGKYLHNLVRSQMWTHQSILQSPGWLLVPCIGLSIITCSHIYLHNLPLRSAAHREFLKFEPKYNKKRIKIFQCHIKKNNGISEYLEKTFSYLLSDSREIRLPEKFNTRNFPPDGTTFQQIVLGQKLAVTIPPFGYLNVQFFHQVSMQMR